MKKQAKLGGRPLILAPRRQKQAVYESKASPV